MEKFSIGNLANQFITEINKLQAQASKLAGYGGVCMTCMTVQLQPFDAGIPPPSST